MLRDLDEFEKKSKQAAKRASSFRIGGNGNGATGKHLQVRRFLARLLASPSMGG
jgi:hypothetical protein